MFGITKQGIEAGDEAQPPSWLLISTFHKIVGLS